MQLWPHESKRIRYTSHLFSIHSFWSRHFVYKTSQQKMPTQSEVRNILIVMTAAMVSFNSFQLIDTISYSTRDQIIQEVGPSIPFSHGWCTWSSLFLFPSDQSLNLLFDIGFLYAIVRQLEKILKVYNITVLFVSIFFAIASILCFNIIIAESGSKVEENIQESTSKVVFKMFFYTLQAYLLRKYLSQTNHIEVLAVYTSGGPLVLSANAENPVRTSLHL